jgi:nucleoside-diphosphate-sugar epimerase
MIENISLTGSTGFLGRIIVESLQNNFAINCITKKDFDFLNSTKLSVSNFSDLIVHSAGKAHSVPKTDQEKTEFFEINFEGTKRFLKSIQSCPILPKSFVFISSVAVYGLNSGNNIVENTPLNAKDPYGKSKIMAEKLVQDWCLENNVICTILRLPLLIGIDPKGNLQTMIDGIRRGFYLNVGGGKARKSMVLASDVAKFIPKVAEIGGIFNLTDGYHPNFNELSSLIASQLGKSKPFNIPKSLIFVLAKIGDLIGYNLPINSDKFNKITSELTFDDTKARKLAYWKPTPVLEGFKIN